MELGLWFNRKMSYQYWKHCGDKMAVRLYKLLNGNSYTDKTTWVESAPQIQLMLALALLGARTSAGTVMTALTGFSLKLIGRSQPEQYSTGGVQMRAMLLFEMLNISIMKIYYIHNCNLYYLFRITDVFAIGQWVNEFELITPTISQYFLRLVP